MNRPVIQSSCQLSSIASYVLKPKAFLNLSFTMAFNPSAMLVLYYFFGEEPVQDWVPMLTETTFNFLIGSIRALLSTWHLATTYVLKEP